MASGGGGPYHGAMKRNEWGNLIGAAIAVVLSFFAGAIHQWVMAAGLFVVAAAAAIAVVAAYRYRKRNAKGS